MGRLPLVVGALVPALLGSFCFWVRSVPELPHIELEYWGSGERIPDDTSIKSFNISVPDSELAFLKKKLELTSPLPPPLQGVTQEYGINTVYLAELLEFWRKSYNWREREKILNRYPHFKTVIGGLGIHFVHVKPSKDQIKGKEVVPLVLVHGWPGTVKEFYDVIPLLTTPREGMDFVFELVIPSLPGFGFSDPASRPGMGPPQMATIINELMRRLGHDRYFYQGGDWGVIIGQSATLLFPDRILGFHTNLCVATTFEAKARAALAYLLPSIFVPEDKRKMYNEQFFEYYVIESAYYHFQATKPDTIGVALTDSPLGLAGYILEKFSTVTNKDFRSLPDAGLSMFKKEDLLDIIMIFALTRTITPAMRIYYEHHHHISHSSTIANIPVKVPTGCARFPHEILYYPDFVLNSQYENLVSITDMKSGGHFAAFEQPQLLADDLFKFVNIVRNLNKRT